MTTRPTLSRPSGAGKDAPCATGALRRRGVRDPLRGEAVQPMAGAVDGHLPPEASVDDDADLAAPRPRGALLRAVRWRIPISLSCFTALTLGSAPGWCFCLKGEETEKEIISSAPQATQQQK